MRSPPRPVSSFDDSLAGVLEAIEFCYAQGWTDGMPVVPPTRRLVDEMVAAAGHPRARAFGLAPQRRGIATVETVAINAVMAGCRPEYMPVVLAAVEAVLDPVFNLGGVQATTHPCTPLVLVSGPIVR